MLSNEAIFHYTSLFMNIWQNEKISEGSQGSNTLSHTSSSSVDQLHGEVDRVTFYNAENGWTVLKVRDLDSHQSITVTGSLPPIQEGEYLQFVGAWTSHATYGRQFKAERAIPTRPTTKLGILRYLCSGIIEGIGEKTAERIVDHFGLDTFKVLDENPGCLLQVPKIGKKKAQLIIESWKAQKAISDIMMFLVNNGISASFAVRIIKMYGENAVEVVSANPYQLATDIVGIGFLKADAIARAIGVAIDSKERIRAAVIYQIQQFEEKGHCYVTMSQLVQSLMELLTIDSKNHSSFQKRVQDEINVLQDSMSIVLEKLKIDSEDNIAIWRPELYYAEATIVESLARLKKRSSDIDSTRISNWIDKFNQASQHPLSAKQSQAVLMSASQRVFILTGGPGVGKTTTANAIIRLFKAMGKTVLLAAPTGRAAQRLSEVSGESAKTIHRLLEWQAQDAAFARNEENPLAADVVICDECSMLDVKLADALFSAVSGHSQLILLGDVDQLPSVGPGNILRDLIESDQIPFVKLTEIFRQAASSAIIRNAHMINTSEMPSFSIDSPSDCQFIEAQTGEEILQVINKLVTDVLPQKYRFDAKRDVQILSPMNRGEVGVHAMNEFLQDILNPLKADFLGDSPKKSKSNIRQFRLGDKVIQTVNNYDLQVFNGDIGFVEQLDVEGGQNTIVFNDNRVVTYNQEQLKDLRLAYAITIHKSQGSEFPVVVLPMTMQHYVMLQKNLVYTALTRAKKLAIFVGAKRALLHAVKNQLNATRQTYLKQRLIESLTP